MIYLSSVLFAGAGTLSLLLWVKAGNGLPGCGGDSGCSAVTTSRWSRLGPIPVTLCGMVLYAALCASVLLEQVQPASHLADVIDALTIFSLGCAAWFLVIQALILRRFCFYCMLIHTAAISGAIVWILKRPEMDALSLVGGIAAAISWALLQVLIQPKLYRLMRADKIDKDSSTATSVQPTTPRSETLTLFGGKITLNRSQWPLIGSPQATHTVAMIFDITCGECRKAYRQWLALTRGPLGKELALLAIPTPMNKQCNPDVCPTAKPNPEACEYAQLLLALWRKSPDLYRQFESWALDGDAVRPFFEARSVAGRALGSSLTFALTDNALLRKAVEIYAALRPDKLPQLILPHGVVEGDIPPETLVRELKQVR